MRVIAGSARRLPLSTVEGLDTRPTQDRIKETLFNMIQSYMQGCVFVDLFSGSGAIGIEALSRGAKKAYFIERNEKAYDVICKNLAFTKLAENAIVKKQDVLAGISSIYEDEVDYIYIDPPYADGVEEKVLELLGKASYVTDNTVIIIEAALTTDFSFVEQLGFAIIKEKKYRTNKHVFLERIL